MQATVSKKVRPGAIEIDLLKKAIVIHYEAIIVNRDEATGALHKTIRPNKKTFPVGVFSRENIPEIVDELILGCSLFTESNRDLLKCLLGALLENRELAICGEPSINKINQYIECFYDELPIKIEATSRIFKLCEKAENLNVLAFNDVLLAALTRSLREDGAKSMLFATNICFIFFSLSHHCTYGRQLLRQNIPDALIRLIEQEEKRHKVWYTKIAKIKKDVQAAKDMEKESKKKYYLEEYERYKRMIEIQDKLLFAAIHTVINLSEAASELQNELILFCEIEKFVSYIGTIIKRRPINQPLVALAVTFLRRLAITPEGARLTMSTDILANVIKLLGEDTAGSSVDSILRFLYNLCFDDTARHTIVRAGVLLSLQPHFSKLLQELVAVLGEKLSITSISGGTSWPEVSQLLPIVSRHDCRAETAELDHITNVVVAYARFLYILSTDDLGLESFERTDILMFSILAACLLPKPPIELIALLVNLFISGRTTLPVIASGILVPLSRQAVRLDTPEFYLMFSNIATHYPMIPKRQITDKSFAHIPELMDVMLKRDSDKYTTVLLGAVASAPLRFIAKNPGVLKFTVSLILRNSSPELLKLEAISMLSNLLNSGKVLLNPDHVKKLPETLLSFLVKLEDEPDYVGTILLCILKACVHENFRSVFLATKNFFSCILKFLYETDETMLTVPPPRSSSRVRSRSTTTTRGSGHRKEGAFVIKSASDSFHGRSAYICSVLASMILDVIAAEEPSQLDTITSLKFRKYNTELLAALES